MSVLVVATGGTIASRPSPDGVRGALLGADLLDQAGETVDGIEVLDVGRGPSWAFTPAAVEHLARTVVDAAVGGRFDGVVVTHGTDTMEESAFLAWLLGGAAASERCPIVFTGAMRNAGHAEPDGPANLRAALQVALGGGRPGPVVCMAGEVHHARWVRKTDTSALRAFGSYGLGSPSPPAAPPPPHGDRVVAEVAELHAHTGVVGTLVDQLLDRGTAGLVVVGTGAGNVHADFVPGIERALGAGVPVVVTSRCWTGPVLAEYGGPGGGRFLADLGCLLAGDLPANQARVALSVALGFDPSLAGVRAWFDELLRAVAVE